MNDLIAVHDLGGEGEPLLVCHATGLCGRMYAPFARTLGARHHVFAVDLRGHGDSPLWSGASLEWFDITADVLDAASRIVPRPTDGRIHLFGHSLGGAVALAAAVAEPERFASVFLFEPIVPPTRMRVPSELNPMVASAMKRTEVFASRADARKRFASRPSLGLLDDEVLDSYVRSGLLDLPDGTVRLKCRARTEAMIYETTGGISVEDIAHIEQPVTIGSGDPERSVLAALAVGAAAGIDGAHHIVYPELSHMGPLQYPRHLSADLIDHTALRR
jgi:pimeloyl-ACP methyl ester carboxylesterase